MTHRDGLPRFSALSVRCGDAGHREACATPSESLGKPPTRSLWVMISAPWYKTGPGPQGLVCPSSAIRAVIKGGRAKAPVWTAGA